MSTFILFGIKLTIFISHEYALVCALWSDHVIAPGAKLKVWLESSGA